LTVPLPDPLPLPALTVIHDALLVAVQPHPAAAVTDTLAAPPADVAPGLVGATVKARGA
jgi:hypothetical protein